MHYESRNQRDLRSFFLGLNLSLLNLQAIFYNTLLLLYSEEERNFEFVNAVSALQKFYNGGRPEVMLLGINLDGSLNGAFLDFLTELADIKFPATVNTRSYMVRRSLAITRWIRNIQVAFLRSVSDNIARSAALYSSRSREVVESILTNMPNTGINP